MSCEDRSPGFSLGALCPGFSLGALCPGFSLDSTFTMTIGLLYLQDGALDHKTVEA